MSNNKEWLSIEEYAKLINRTVMTVYLNVRLGKIPKEKIKRKKKIIPIKKNVLYIKNPQSNSDYR